MKKITLSRIFVAIAAVALLPLTGVTSNSHAATIPDEQFVVGTSQTSSGQELLGLSIADDSTASSAPSWLLADPDGTGNGIKQRLCTSMADINCSNAQSVLYVATLPVCATADSSNCIVGLSAISATGAVVEGKAVKTVPAQGWTDYPGDASLNLPTGASPTLFTIPGVLNGAGTENYLVTFKAFGQKPRSVSKFSTGRVLASISPVTIQSGQYGRMHAVDARNRRADCAQASLPCGLSVDGSSYLDDKACASLDDGSCALKQAFPSGYRFKLVVNLGNSPVGWFHGRIKSPDLSITTISTGIQLSLAADPVTIPTVGTAVPRLSLPANMQAYYKDGLGSQGLSWGDLGPHGLRNQLALPSPSTQEAFDQFQLWSSYFNDKASASPTVWNFQTLGLRANSSSCFRNDSQLIGVVTTNSMMYSGGPPSFNATDGVLEYKVGSPHYKSNGDVFQGSYDLQVRSDVARCLYGFSAAPVKASLTVTSESGAANVASTAVTESGGWLRMAAYGFTFSNPTIKVKLSQDAPVPVAAKKVTITCVKGKTTKSVTAVKPVCPTGYKKK
jgi:hypothetical protein